MTNCQCKFCISAEGKQQQRVYKRKYYYNHSRYIRLQQRNYYNIYYHKNKKRLLTLDRDARLFKQLIKTVRGSVFCRHKECRMLIPFPIYPAKLRRHRIEFHSY